MSKVALLLACIVCGILQPMQAFLPNHIRDVNTASSLTHKDITSNAIHRVAVLYMNKYPEIFPDHDAALAKDSFVDALTTFRKAAADPGVTLPYAEDPIVHFNAELIVEGNQRILQERSKVIQAITDEDWNGAREFTGGLLHSLQDFYSNTNWVEMGNSDIHPALGQPGMAYDIGFVADLNMPTCSDCTTQTCTNNILEAINIDRILTSGYMRHQGYGTQDPEDWKPVGRSKCSHGGSSDITATISATGGINKDSNVEDLSPHHYLHTEAARLAEEASLTFLKSIWDIRTDNEFAQFIGLLPGTSLCFVIDTTGSMSDDIAAVKEVTINITRDTAGSLNAPSEYVLSPFNDPGFGPVVKTDDPEVMIQALSDLTATGGGDAPELAFSGIILALNNVRPGSICYGFTDAPAKDLHLQDSAIAIADEKNVIVNMLLTVNTRRNNDLNTRKTEKELKRISTLSDYDRITQETGGQSIHTSKSEIGEVVKIVDSTLSTSQVNVVQNDNLISPQTTNIPVDQSMSNMIITVTSSGTITGVNITDPTGTVHIPGAPGSGADVILTTNATSVKMYSVTSPRAGVWSVSTTTVGAFSLKATADSFIDFKYQFVEKVPHGLGYRELVGRPLKDVENIVVLETFGRTSSSSGLQEVTDLVLVSQNGTELSRLALFELVPFTEYEAAFILPNNGFRLVLEGKDQSGNIIQRLDSAVIRTAQSIITVNENIVLEAGETIDVNITVTNKGPSDTYTLDIHDESGFLDSVGPTSFTLDTDESVVVIATFESPESLPAGQVSSVTITTANTIGDDRNFAMFRLSTETKNADTTAPTCNISYSAGECLASFYEDTPCANDFWSISFTASDDVGIFTVKPYETHAHSEFLLDQDFVSGNLTVNGNYTSDCCVPRITITVSDAFGNAGRCTKAHQYNGANRVGSHMNSIWTLFISATVFYLHI